MAAEGALVVLADIQDDRGQRLADELGDDARYVHCDVTSEPDVPGIADTAVAEFGRLDCMFNNAGIVGAHSGHTLVVDGGLTTGSKEDVAPGEHGRWASRRDLVREAGR